MTPSTWPLNRLTSVSSRSGISSELPRKTQNPASSARRWAARISGGKNGLVTSGTTTARLPWRPVDSARATWFGTFAPAKLPAELRDRITKDIQAIVATPEMTKKLEDMGAEVNNLGSQDFSKLIDAEAKRWAEAVKISGAKVE